MAFIGGFGVGVSHFGGAAMNRAKKHINRASSTRVNMVLSEGSSEKLADFSRPNLEAGNEFEGMVFNRDTMEFPLTRVNVDYRETCEAAINQQINVEFTASYAYNAIYAYFDRDAVALPGFAKFFKEMSDEEREHAENFIRYQNTRGGRVVLKPVAVPEMHFTYVDGTSDALYAMDLHLQLEKFVYEKLKGVHKVAEEAGDSQLCETIEIYLTEQVKSIKVAGQYVAQIRRVGTGHGVYDIDTQLLHGNRIQAPEFSPEKVAREAHA